MRFGDPLQRHLGLAPSAGGLRHAAGLLGAAAQDVEAGKPRGPEASPFGTGVPIFLFLVFFSHLFDPLKMVRVKTRAGVLPGRKPNVFCQLFGTRCRGDVFRLDIWGLLEEG